MSAAVLFCPNDYAENVARVDKGWTPATDATPGAMAWVTPEGERVDHASSIEWLFSVRGLRVYLGFGCAWRDICEIRTMARSGRITIVGEERS